MTSFVVKKGKIEEIFSKALYADNATKYIVYYRDFEVIKKMDLPTFLEESDNMKIIPASRIELIKKGNLILFEKKRGD